MLLPCLFTTHLLAWIVVSHLQCLSMNLSVSLVHIILIIKMECGFICGKDLSNSTYQNNVKHCSFDIDCWKTAFREDGLRDSKIQSN